MTTPASPHSIDALLRAVERDVKPGGRVIVGNTDMRRVPYNDTFLYYLLPRYVPGTASMEFEPGLTNRRGTTLTGEMERADAFIASDRWLTWNEPNDSMKPGDPGPAEVLHRDFCLQARLRERLQAVPALHARSMTGAESARLGQVDHLEARIVAERPVRAEHRERRFDRRASGSQLRVVDDDEPHAEARGAAPRCRPRSNGSVGRPARREPAVGGAVAPQLVEGAEAGRGHGASTTGSPRTIPRSRQPACDGTPAGSRTRDRSRRERSARCRPDAPSRAISRSACSLAGVVAERRRGQRHEEVRREQHAGADRDHRGAAGQAGRGCRCNTIAVAATSNATSTYSTRTGARSAPRPGTASSSR